MKILVVIANYGIKQKEYIVQMVKEFKSYPVEVDIIINSNVALNIEGTIDNVFDLEDKEKYPLSTRKTILQNKGKYDLYIFTEGDMLITWNNIKFWLESTSNLPTDIITGFMRYEIDENLNKEFPLNRTYCDMHHMNNPWVWDYDSPFIHRDIIYAEFTNKHQGCFILNNDHLNYVTSKIDFNDIDTKYTVYGVIERANMDVFSCFRKKLIAISHFDNSLIHHMSNRMSKIPSNSEIYWMRGVDEETMQNHIKLLKFYAKHWKVNEEFTIENPNYILNGVNHNKGIK